MNTSIHSSVVFTLFALAFSTYSACGGWAEVPVGAGDKKVTIGQARNDGVTRVYSVNTVWTDLAEYSWAGGGWNAVLIGGPRYSSPQVGTARADGITRLYVGGNSRFMHEYTWVPATTSYSDLSMPSAPSTLNRVDFADGRNDGIKRVLVGNQDGRIYDLTFQNGNWIQDLVVQSFGAVKGLAVGPGRNDGVNRIYASKGGSLKEYTYTPTTSAPFAAQLLPNGILEWSSNPGGVYDVEWSSDLTTWRSDWSLLTGIPATGATTQQPIPRFFRVKRRTE